MEGDIFVIAERSEGSLTAHTRKASYRMMSVRERAKSDGALAVAM
jgi:hypothetical protein